MQVTGEIKTINLTENVSEKFKKREFVLITDKSTQYPQTILFELQQDKCDIIDAYSVGQEVSVDYNLKGRQWTNTQGEVKTFNTLSVWKIQPVNNK
jgi:hypothetical protein